MTLEGKVALITGASRSQGIGAAVARELAAKGANIFITTYSAYDARMDWGSEPNAPLRLVAELGRMGVQASILEIDLSQPEAPARTFDAAETHVGAVDILVNNAAVSINAGIDELSADLIDQHYLVNVRGMMLLCQEFVKRWQQHGKTEGGRIINLTSGQGIGAMPDELPYAATKGAVDAFTLSLSAGVMAYGITVNAIDPGITQTGWISEALQQQFVRQHPAGRVGTPADAAHLLGWLASEDASWVTGQIIRSRGGL